MSEETTADFSGISPRCFRSLSCLRLFHFIPPSRFKVSGLRTREDVLVHCCSTQSNGEIAYHFQHRLISEEPRCSGYGTTSLAAATNRWEKKPVAIQYAPPAHIETKARYIQFRMANQSHVLQRLLYYDHRIFTSELCQSRRFVTILLVTLSSGESGGHVAKKGQRSPPTPGP